MTKPKTVWKAEPHTLAKHEILDQYLRAWIPILSAQVARGKSDANRIRFIDAFAGPGVYAKGEPGSPIRAIQVALSRSRELPTPIEFVFIELDKDRHQSLESELSKLHIDTSGSPAIDKVRVVCGDCNEELPKILAEMPAQQFCPSLFFLDQFGYADVSMDLVKTLMSRQSHEVFSYLNWNNLTRFITDEGKVASLSLAFGSDVWKQCRDLSSDKRHVRFLELYQAALHQNAKVKYVRSFAMHGKDNKLLNWLFFCTNHLRGLEVMKGAMAKVDGTGMYAFSDGFASDQMILLSTLSDDWLADQLAVRLEGQQRTVAQVKEFVLEETPAIKFKGALAILQKDNRLHPANPAGQRVANKFSDEDLLLNFWPHPQRKVHRQGGLFGQPE